MLDAERLCDELEDELADKAGTALLADLNRMARRYRRLDQLDGMLAEQLERSMNAQDPETAQAANAMVNQLRRLKNHLRARRQ